MIVFFKAYTAIIFIALFFLNSCSTHQTPSDLQVLDSKQSLFYNRLSTRLLAHYYDWQGTAYREGGITKNGIDCSGFVVITYRKIFKLELPRSTDSQEQMCQKIYYNDLLPGDLLFFNTGWFSKHVGIFINDNLFIHASTSQGITISSLTNHYWNDAFYLAKRCYIH